MEIPNDELKGEHIFHEGPSLAQSAASKFFMAPACDLFRKGVHSHIQHKHLWRLKQQESTKVIFDQFEKKWLESIEAGKPSVFRALMSVVGMDLLIALFLFFLQAASVFTLPLLIKYIILYLADPRVPTWYGYVYFVAVYISSLAGSFFYQHASIIIWRSGIIIRSALMTLVYRKALYLAPGAVGNSGTIINLMSSDAQIILDSLLWFVQGLLSPLQFAVILGMLSRSIGNFALIPLGILFLGVPVMAFAAGNVGRLRLLIQMVADKRIKLTTELITAIRIVKYYAWERPFSANIDETRKKEIAHLKNFLKARAALFVVLLNLAPLSLGLTIILYSIKNDLGLGETFTAIAYLNMLRIPFIFFPITTTFTGQYYVSIGRIQNFALLPEIESPGLSADPENRGGMYISGGTFSWPVKVKKQEKDKKKKNADVQDSETHSTDSTDDEQPDDVINNDGDIVRQKVILKDINLDVKKGSLSVVVGSVGSGKSSLAMAFLREMPKVSGEVFVPTTLGYAAQEAWIINTTIRQNILFGQEYDHEYYQEVVRRCSLITDFALFPAGDMTEVAERGSNLSGGQRQRINIARALYSRRDTYIFDDPFSAVDAHVGEHLFEHVMLPLKREGKTVLLITNQLQFLPKCDYVSILKKGRIVEQGTFSELLAKKGALFDLAEEFGLKADKKTETKISHVPQQAPLISKKEAIKLDKLNYEKGKLVEQEGTDKGVVSGKTYWAYFYANPFAFFLLILILIFNSLRIAARVGGSVWLSRWVNPATTKERSKNEWIGVYAGLLASEIATAISFTMTMIFLNTSISRSIHRRLLGSIIRASTRFFDTTPIGRLLARFSKDINIVDNNLPNQAEQLLDTAFQLVGVFANLATGTPYAIIIVAVVMIIYIVLLVLFRHPSTQIQRIEATTRAPIYTHFNETIEGAASIRAYNMEKVFETANLAKVDANAVDYLAMKRLTIWFSLTTEQLAALGVGGIVLMLVLFRNYSPSTISIGLAANALGNAVSILGLMSAVNANFAELESRLNSVERIVQYQDNEQEAEYEIPETTPSEHWPHEGSINFDDLVVEYTKDVPVLKNITASIKPGEKIGIVGRTGAGKSTLITALFRTTEPRSGKVTIDGVDISTLGLYDLRRKLSIIPQVPQLFLGTVRYNLDPFGECTDDRLWQVLKRVKLSKHIKQLPGGLDGAIEENGSNFSVGQRQLLSMARCLLRDTHILLLDEATASLDVESDALIQRMIRKYFADRTVVTIAHRLVTIIDSDRVMVLDQGRIAEFDSPKKLLENKRGILYSMVQATGPATAAHLKRIAMGQVSVADALLERPDLLESSAVFTEGSFLESIDSSTAGEEDEDDNLE